MSRLVAGGSNGIAGTIYGTVLVLATLVAAAAEHAGQGIVEAVAASVIVIWIAHVYAHALGESIEHQHRLDGAAVRGIAVGQLPILVAALLPVIVLLLGRVGVMRQNRAIWIALGVGLATLAIQGVRYARVERLGRTGTTVVVALNLALGGAVVVLKVLALH